MHSHWVFGRHQAGQVQLTSSRAGLPFKATQMGWQNRPTGTTWNSNLDKVLLLEQAGVWWAGEQLSWKGPEAPSRQQAEPKPDMHPGNKANKHAGLYQQKHSRQIEVTHYCSLLSTCWITSGRLHLVLGQCTVTLITGVGSAKGHQFEGDCSSSPGKKGWRNWAHLA